jgi:photosystem II stability/assembly factor-like uncharacterized protein
MKKILWIVSAMLFVIASTPLGRVFAQTKGSISGEHMFSIDFVDEKEGFASGDRGAVYHTADGGLNWEKQTLNTTDPLSAISFCNPKVGWVVGKGGTIFHTLDGGKTWSKQTTPKDKYLLTVKALSPEKCWAAGDWGTILYTEDGGKTWIDKTYSKDMLIYAIDFHGQREGWMACEFGTVLHTKDGGVNWTQQDTGLDATLFAISFATERVGLAVGLGGVIIRTEDGGNTWVQVHESKGKNGRSEMTEQAPASEEQEGAGTEEEVRSLYAVKMRENTGIAVGDAGNIVVTGDGGKTWARITLPLDMKLFWFGGVALANPKAVITGARSVVILTEGDSLKSFGYMRKID